MRRVYPARLVRQSHQSPEKTAPVAPANDSGGGDLLPAVVSHAGAHSAPSDASRGLICGSGKWARSGSHKFRHECSSAPLELQPAAGPAGSAARRVPRPCVSSGRRPRGMQRSSGLPARRLSRGARAARRSPSGREGSQKCPILGWLRHSTQRSSTSRTRRIAIEFAGYSGFQIVG